MLKFSNASIFVLAVLLGSKVSTVSAFEGTPVPLGFLQELTAVEKVQNQSKTLNSRIPIQLAPQISTVRVSKRKAIIMSMLLPGLGESSIGSYRAAKYFYGSESSLWLSLFILQKRKEWKKEDYQVYAAAEAGVNNEGKDDQFYSDVSNFSDVDEFNAAIRRSRDPRSVYSAANEFWSWSSEEERLKFKSLKLESDTAGQNMKRIFGGMIVNRILSVMNTIYRYNKLNSDPMMSIYIGTDFELSLTAKF